MYVLCRSRMQALRALDMIGVMAAGDLSIRIYTDPEALRGADLTGRVVLSIAGEEGFPADLEGQALVCRAAWVARMVRAPVFSAQFQGPDVAREAE